MRYNKNMLIAIALCFILLLIVLALAKSAAKVKEANIRFRELCPEVESYFAEIEKLGRSGYISLAQKEELKNRYEYAFTGAVNLEKAELPARIRHRVSVFLDSYRKIDEFVTQHNTDCRK